MYHYSIFVDVDRIPKVNVTPCSVANNVTLHTTTWMYYYFIYSNLCITLSHSNISLLLRGACCPRGGHGARILNSEHKEPWIQVLSNVKIVFTLFYFFHEECFDLIKTRWCFKKVFLLFDEGWGPQKVFLMAVCQLQLRFLASSAGKIIKKICSNIIVNLFVCWIHRFCWVIGH